MKTSYLLVKQILIISSAFLFFTACQKSNETPSPGFSSLDSAINSKMSQYNIPGLSLSIVKNDKLVYSKSFGFADLQANQRATNSNLYRIGTISQELTTIAILKLVQDGKLSLSQKVFGSNGILGEVYGIPPAGSNVELITVQHLLDHKSGWTNTPLDDLLQWNKDWVQSRLIKNVVENWRLTYQPGSVYYKLNFGYAVLGSIIEKLAGTSYEDYVKTNLLSPVGITDMHIGGSNLAQRFPNEVKYQIIPTSSSQDPPYNTYNLPQGDASIGWVASSADLVKLMTLVDGDATVPDILPSTLLDQHSHFDLYRWTNNSSIVGSNSVLCKLDDDFIFSVLTNASDVDGNVNSTMLADLYSTISNEIYAIPSWPGSKAVNPYAGDYPAGTYNWSYRRWNSTDTTTALTATSNGAISWDVVNDTKLQFSGGYGLQVGINEPYVFTFDKSSTGELSNFNVTIDPSLTNGLTAFGVTITQAPAIMKMTLTPTKKYFKIWYRVKNSLGDDRTIIDEYWMP